MDSKGDTCFMNMVTVHIHFKLIIYYSLSLDVNANEYWLYNFEVGVSVTRSGSSGVFAAFTAASICAFAPGALKGTLL